MNALVRTQWGAGGSRSKTYGDPVGWDVRPTAASLRLVVRMNYCKGAAVAVTKELISCLGVVVSVITLDAKRVVIG